MKIIEESKEAFKEIYPELISGRYENDNATLMKWIQESNPQFDIANAASLYDKLAIAIESNREQFFVEQKKLQSYNGYESENGEFKNLNLLPEDEMNRYKVPYWCTSLN